MKKITIILTIVAIMFALFSNFNVVRADGLFENIQSEARTWLRKGQSGLSISSDTIAGIAIPIFQMMITIASIVVTIVTIIMGIKYMTTSPEGKAKLKQQLIGLVLAVIVIWGAQGIWAFMATFLESITG